MQSSISIHNSKLDLKESSNEDNKYELTEKIGANDNPDESQTSNKDSVEKLKNSKHSEK